MDALTLNKEGVGGEGCACWSLPGTDLGDGLLTVSQHRKTRQSTYTLLHTQDTPKQCYQNNTPQIVHNSQVLFSLSLSLKESIELTIQ